jgi:two-component system, LytTR family, response regulator
LKTRVLIVDDEPIARRGSRRYLAEHDGIEVVGEAANGISAVEKINELHPDIVFLDVQMPDLDGFGVIENVEPSTGPAPVYVFVTAHDVHAIRAFEVHAVDYLLKPFDKERFAKALVHARQVLEQCRKADPALEPLLQSLRSLRPWERFVVKDKKRIFFVPVSHVLWIEATGNYACIHTASDPSPGAGNHGTPGGEAGATPVHPRTEIGHRERCPHQRDSSDVRWGLRHRTGRRNGGHVEPQIRSQVTGTAGILVFYVNHDGR